MAQGDQGPAIFGGKSKDEDLEEGAYAEGRPRIEPVLSVRPRGPLGGSLCPYSICTLRACRSGPEWSLAKKMRPLWAQCAMLRPAHRPLCVLFSVPLPPEDVYFSPFAGIEKGQVLQEARCFHDPQLDARRCQQASGC